MDLESKALSASRGNAHNGEKSRTKSPSASSIIQDDCNHDDSDQDDGSSRNSNEFNSVKNKRTAVSASGISKKRRRVDDENTVAIYNIPPETDCATLEAFVESMFLEMHKRKIKILGTKKIPCQHTNDSGRVRYTCTFLVTFETAKITDLAISLNGVQFLEQTIYASICTPDWSLKRTKKLQPCYKFLFGACDRPANKCRHAHGVLDLKLYQETVLSNARTIYINNIPSNYTPEHLLNMIRKILKNHGISPFFTAFHVRGGKGDALVEFADIRHAKKAHKIISGTPISRRKKLEVHAWKPAYQSVFVEYLENEDRNRTKEHRKHVSAPGTPSNPKKTAGIGKKDKDAPIDASPQNQAKALPPKKDHEQTVLAAEWEDDKRELQRLRDEVYQLKSNEKKLASLEEENNECKRLLDEAHDDVQYYRDKYERERSYAKGVRRMEDEVDDLRRDNDHLIRENDLLVRENDDLRYKHHDSRSLGEYRSRSNALKDELHQTKLKYEESRDRIYDLKCELHKTMEENEVLVRDSKRLKISVERLESNKKRVKMENEQVSHRQDELQRRLDEALSTIETLNGALATTQLQLKGMESERGAMNKTITDPQVQNDTLEEEMEQMRMNHAMELGFTGAEAENS